MKKINFLISLFLVCFGFSVSAQTPNKAIIGFYNLENLFDTINDPLKNDEQFLPRGDYQWTSERYLHKLDRLSQIPPMELPVLTPKALSSCGVWPSASSTKADTLPRRML